MTRHPILRQARLLACLAVLIGSVTVPAVAQHMTTDPGAVLLEVDDIRMLAEVLRSTAGAADMDVATVIEREYLGNASPGLLAYAQQFDVTGASIASALDSHPTWYGDLDGLADAILARDEELEAGFRRLQELFPGAVFPPVWFVVGDAGPRGQASPVGALIGALGLADRPEEIAPLVLHELAHFQSGMVQGVEVYRRIYGPERTLLALALREGTAEFIAHMTTGRHTNPAAERYGLEHEAELWAAFREEMHGGVTGDWMWVRPADTDRPQDLGYWIGYRIVDSYYEQADDKAQAILDIIGLIDFNAFLEASAYAKQFENGDSTSPSRSDTRWEMTSIDGEHLPIVNEFEHSAWGLCRVEVLSGSLVLSADHQFRLETLRKIHCDQDGESTVAQEEPEWLEGAYTLEAGQLTLSVSDPNFGDIWFSGAVSGDNLRVRFDENELRFRPGT
jgi:hypothetical protein